MSFFNRLSPRDQILVVVGFITLVVVLVVFLILLPQFGRLGALSAKQQSLTKSLKEAKLNLDRLKAIKGEAAQIEAKLIKLTRRIPEEAEVPSLLVELQSVANSAGLDFSSAKLDEMVDKTGYSEIPVTVNAKGTFYSLVDYLYRLENTSRKIVVTDVDVSVEEKKYPTLEMEIKAKAYKLNESAAPAVPPPKSPGASSGEPTPAGEQSPSGSAN